LDSYQEGSEFQENRSNWTQVKSINKTYTVRGSNAKDVGNVSCENENPNYPVQDTELCILSRLKNGVIFKNFLWT
jgi:hypothetical protein